MLERAFDVLNSARCFLGRSKHRWRQCENCGFVDSRPLSAKISGKTPPGVIVVWIEVMGMRMRAWRFRNMIKLARSLGRRVDRRSKQRRKPSSRVVQSRRSIGMEFGAEWLADGAGASLRGEACHGLHSRWHRQHTVRMHLHRSRNVLGHSDIQVWPASETRHSLPYCSPSPPTRSAVRSLSLPSHFLCDFICPTLHAHSASKRLSRLASPNPLEPRSGVGCSFNGEPNRQRLQPQPVFPSDLSHVRVTTTRLLLIPSPRRPGHGVGLLSERERTFGMGYSGIAPGLRPAVEADALFAGLDGHRR
ncbi:uncharacterized protein MYCFIDRAFT_211207, partial [Pseudocercospora fijiensis CIRAD86]